MVMTMVMVTMVHILCQTYHGEEMLEPKKGAHVPKDETFDQNPRAVKPI